MFEITENIFAEISEFQGNKRIDIRRWYKKDDEWHRTRKGINLSKDEWNDFVSNFEEMKDYLAKNS